MLVFHCYCIRYRVILAIDDVVNSTPHQKNDSKAAFYEADLRDNEALERVFEAHNVIINLVYLFYRGFFWSCLFGAWCLFGAKR